MNSKQNAIVLNAEEFRQFCLFTFLKVVQRHIQGVLGNVAWVLLQQ